MRDSGTAPHVRTALEDMAEVFVPHLPLNTIEDLYDLLKSFLDVSPILCWAPKFTSLVLSFKIEYRSSYSEEGIQVTECHSIL